MSTNVEKEKDTFKDSVKVEDNFYLFSSSSPSLYLLLAYIDFR